MGNVYPGQPRIFDAYTSQVKGVGNNQAVITAPVAGFSIYLQSVSISNNGLAAGAVAEADLKDASGGNLIFSLAISGTSNLYSWATFPGGLKLPAAQGLFVDVITNTIRLNVTYTIGPAL